jgi:general secretion pathway protein K
MRAEGGTARPRGFALLIVLWSMALMALIVAEIGLGGRTESRIAANLVANAKAAAVSDGAVMEAIYRLSRPTDDRWTANGETHLLVRARARAHVTATAENGKVNPNGATPQLMRGLLSACGAGDDDAARISVAILDWRSPGETAHPQGAKMPEYRGAGLDYAPPNAPFQSLDELRLVFGMTPALYACLKPHLSLYATGEIDRSAADPLVAGLLPAPAPGGTVAAANPQAPQIVSILAETETDDGGHASRHAVVQLGPGLPRGYALLSWDSDPAGL